MFTNVGGKIKTLAVIICSIGIAASVLADFDLIREEQSGIGFALLFGGSLISWVGCLFLYRFGELIENTAVIAELMVKADAKMNNAE